MEIMFERFKKEDFEKPNVDDFQCGLAKFKINKLEEATTRKGLAMLRLYITIKDDKDMKLNVKKCVLLQGENKWAFRTLLESIYTSPSEIQNLLINNDSIDSSNIIDKTGTCITELDIYNNEKYIKIVKFVERVPKETEKPKIDNVIPVHKPVETPTVEVTNDDIPF